MVSSIGGDREEAEILGAEREEISNPRLFRCKRNEVHNGDAFPKRSRIEGLADD